MRRRGHPIIGAIAGFLFGLFLAVTLTVFGAIAFDSILILALPVVLLVLGVAWGLWAPLGRPPSPRT